MDFLETPKVITYNLGMGFRRFYNKAQALLKGQQ